MLICATVTAPFPFGQLPPSQSPEALNQLSQALADAGFEVVLPTEFGVVVRGSVALFDAVFGVRPSPQGQFNAAVRSEMPALRDIVGRVFVSGIPVPLP
jgi:hypothetical protein